LTVVSLRFASLGSGSRGNALLVESDDTLVMIDCGLSRRTIEHRLRVLGREPSDLAAVLISHEHSDHVQGAEAFLRRYRAPVWMTAGTTAALAALPRTGVLNGHRALRIGSLRIEPYPVPHDAREPCQFVFASAGRRLGLLTDSGCVTPHMHDSLKRCDALALEFNHDVEMLRASAYPASVKARIASRFGHLSNAQSSAFLCAAAHPALQWVAALHLSERNNSPALVSTCFEEAMAGETCSLHIATQSGPTAWCEIV